LRKHGAVVLEVINVKCKQSRCAAFFWAVRPKERVLERCVWSAANGKKKDGGGGRGDRALSRYICAWLTPARVL
jgi:hypothetical protein